MGTWDNNGGKGGGFNNGKGFNKSKGLGFSNGGKGGGFNNGKGFNKGGGFGGKKGCDSYEDRHASRVSNNINNFRSSGDDCERGGDLKGGMENANLASITADAYLVNDDVGNDEFTRKLNAEIVKAKHQKLKKEDIDDDPFRIGKDKLKEYGVDEYGNDLEAIAEEKEKQRQKELEKYKVDLDVLKASDPWAEKAIESIDPWKNQYPDDVSSENDPEEFTFDDEGKYVKKTDIPGRLTVDELGEKPGVSKLKKLPGKGGLLPKVSNGEKGRISRKDRSNNINNLFSSVAGLPGGAVASQSAIDDIRAAMSNLQNSSNDRNSGGKKYGKDDKKGGKGDRNETNDDPFNSNVNGDDPFNPSMSPAFNMSAPPVGEGMMPPPPGGIDSLPPMPEGFTTPLKNETLDEQMLEDMKAYPLTPMETSMDQAMDNIMAGLELSPRTNIMEEGNDTKSSKNRGGVLLPPSRNITRNTGTETPKSRAGRNVSKKEMLAKKKEGLFSSTAREASHDTGKDRSRSRDKNNCTKRARTGRDFVKSDETCICSLHGKTRFKTYLEPDGNGGFVCAVDNPCKETGTMRGEQSPLPMIMEKGCGWCAIHGKKRLKDCLESNGMGEFICKEGWECKEPGKQGNDQKITVLSDNPFCEETTTMVAGKWKTGFCVIHNKERLEKVLIKQSDGTMICKKGYECKGSGGRRNEHGRLARNLGEGLNPNNIPIGGMGAMGGLLVAPPPAMPGSSRDDHRTSSTSGFGRDDHRTSNGFGRADRSLFGGRGRDDRDRGRSRDADRRDFRDKGNLQGKFGGGRDGGKSNAGKFGGSKDNLGSGKSGKDRKGKGKVSLEEQDRRWNNNLSNMNLNNMNNNRNNMNNGTSNNMNNGMNNGTSNNMNNGMSSMGNMFHTGDNTRVSGGKMSQKGGGKARANLNNHPNMRMQNEHLRVVKNSGNEQNPSYLIPSQFDGNGANNNTASQFHHNNGGGAYHSGVDDTTPAETAMNPFDDLAPFDEEDLS